MRLLIVSLCLIISLSNYAQESKRITELQQKLEKATTAKAKLKALEKLWQITAYDNTESAIKYANQAIKLAQENNLKLQTARAYERLGIAYSNISEYSKSNDAYLSAIKLHQELNKPRFVSSLIMNQAINFKDNAQYDSAIHYMNKSESYMNRENYCCKDDTLLEINLHSIKATIYMEQGKYLSSLDNAIIAADISKQLNDSIQYADNLVLIGNNNQALGNNDIAIQYLKEGMKIYKITEDTYYECNTAKDIGALYSGKFPIERDSAEFYLKRAIDLSKAIKVPLLQVQSLNEYGELLLKEKDLIKAKQIFSESELITDVIRDEFSLGRIKLGMGRIFFLEQNFEDAESRTKAALDIFNRIKVLPQTIVSQKQLSDIYKAIGNYRKSLEAHESYKQLSDSLYNKEKSLKFDELQASFDAEKKAAEIRFQNEKIKSLNSKAENDKLTKTLYIIGIVSLLTVLGLLYFGFKQRIKKNRIAREKQEEIYKKEIEFKKKELATQTLHLVQKSTFIQELKENLEKIKKSPELFKVEFRRIVMLLRKQNAEDKDWEVFKSYFSEVHNNFDKKIKSIADDITEKEIRLASFLRMNLSTKEIASMLNVLPDSVLKSKYRLKKKLQLDKDTDLNEFLNTL
ncbi:hypothetical protein AB9K26_09635 [Psychroserpens sp. XS_ASV72]|uniref:hypothetical protein n=1 Tax=Psychroserpens sp. XS_ASV72 TaxID=3241293 RepID=UPI00351931E3